MQYYLVSEEQLSALSAASYACGRDADFEDFDRRELADLNCRAREIPEGAVIVTREEVESVVNIPMVWNVGGGIMGSYMKDLKAIKARLDAIFGEAR